MAEIIGNREESDAIFAMLVDWATAIGEKNAAGVLSHVTDDIVEFTLAPPLQYKGKDQAGLQGWFDTWQGPIEGDVEDQKLTIGGDVAFWSGLTHMLGTKTDGTKVDLWFRQTLGLRKEAGVWKIAHDHTSVPFAMDGSGLAELGLKP
jgi:ketosteroid isomerase-like protein